MSDIISRFSWGVLGAGAAKDATFPSLEITMKRGTLVIR